MQDHVSEHRMHINQTQKLLHHQSDAAAGETESKKRRDLSGTWHRRANTHQSEASIDSIDQSEANIETWAESDTQASQHSLSTRGKNGENGRDLE